ncbi:MAG TPA: class F sortase [Patescibacteria group bacterium]|nr:class F sortase [Patescibacteria group bacterium]
MLLRFSVLSFCLVLTIFGILSLSVSATESSVDTSSFLPLDPFYPFHGPEIHMLRTDSVTTTTQTPLQLTIPSLRVRTLVEQTGLTEQGALAVPGDSRVVGWYNKTGPLVFVSHNIWKGVKGIFYDLKDLKVGSEVQVQNSDGSRDIYVIDRIEPFNKDAFPTELVYSRTEKKTLRLITCHGPIEDGRYTQNLIVFATIR